MAKRRVEKEFNFGGNGGAENDASVILDDNGGITIPSEGNHVDDFQDPGTAATGAEEHPSGDAGAASTHTGTASDTGTETRAKRKYTRRKALPDYLGGFEGLIIAIHSGIASVSKLPELELDEEEARKVAVACDELARFYDVAPSAEVKLWLNFAGTMGAVYAPRIIAISIRRKRERSAPPAPKPTVVPFSAGFPQKEPVQ